MKKMQQKGRFWFILFLVIFLATQDYLWINWPAKTGILGFPNWLFYFMGIHLLFVGVFYFFIKKYWRE